MSKNLTELIREAKRTIITSVMYRERRTRYFRFRAHTCIYVAQRTASDRTFGEFSRCRLADWRQIDLSVSSRKLLFWRRSGFRWVIVFVRHYCTSPRSLSWLEKGRSLAK